MTNPNKKQEVGEKVLDLIFEEYKMSIADGLKVLWNCLRAASYMANKELKKAGKGS